MGPISEFFNAIKMKPEDEYYDDDEYIEDNVARAPSYKKTSEEQERPKKVIQMPRKKAVDSEAGDVFGIKPTEIDDAQLITDTLRDRKIVLLNMEDCEGQKAKRILDFAMGSTYALDGVMQKISNTIFVIVPNGIEITGAFQELVGTSDNEN